MQTHLTTPHPRHAPAPRGRPPVRLTALAAVKAQGILQDTGDANLRLRVAVRDGGYSGYDYEFTLDDAVNADDLTLHDQGVALVVDAMSYQKLRGASVDWVEDEGGRGFVVVNPWAPTPGACGCGGACACAGA